MSPKLRQGFTLIELILALAVSSIIVGLVVSLGIFSQKLWQKMAIENKITNQYMDLSQRLATQISQAAHLGQISGENIPFYPSLNIQELPNGLILVTHNITVNKANYNYQRYFRLGTNL